MKRKDLPGFHYDAKRKRVVLDGFVPGTKCKVRRQRTIENFMADVRAHNCSAHYINDAVCVLEMLLRQAVERDVIADYPIRKRIPKERKCRSAWS